MGGLLVLTTVVAVFVTCIVAISNTGTSLTLLYQNNLNITDDGNHPGAILLDSMTSSEGSAACSAVGETLLSNSTVAQHESDFYHILSYLQYAALVGPATQYYVQNGVVATQNSTGRIVYGTRGQGTQALPVLCSQSSGGTAPGNSPVTSKNQISIVSGGNTYIGYRNKKSFRFVGIPYTNNPARFEYSSIYNQTGQTINATAYGADCAQANDNAASENCLFLNIQTPYIPKQASTTKLRPVLFSIHGGGLRIGNGIGLDGGNLASREDIVTVAINYRLSTLGFFAVPGTNITGNFGIGDQVTALQWVRQNIAQFGGDPNHITIMGESAGGISVRVLLGSPPVVKNNLVIGAIVQSSTGGGVTLGQSGDSGTYGSSYITISQSYAAAGQKIFLGAGCNQTSLQDQITCLKAVSWQTIQNQGPITRSIVIDGTYVVAEQLNVVSANGTTANVNVIFGGNHDDGTLYVAYPPSTIKSEQEGIYRALGISQDYANQIINSGLFPYYDTGNLTLDSYNVSQRVGTDKTFRCIAEASAYAGMKTGVFKSVYFYQMDRTYSGSDSWHLSATGLSTGPVQPGYPYGNPNLPYFRLHGGDVGFSYGNQRPLRDGNDLKAMQLFSGYFAQFAKNGNPNPPSQYLDVRGYTNTTAGIAASGTWAAVNSNTGPAKNLDFPSTTVDFPDLAQCSFLNYSITYYLNSNRG